jgi:hypothetical protein
MIAYLRRHGHVDTMCDLRRENTGSTHEITVEIFLIYNCLESTTASSSIFIPVVSI